MSTQTIITTKNEIIDDDFSVEFEILPLYDSNEIKDDRCKDIETALFNIDQMSKELESKISELNVDIDRLTNHADGIDYTIAVASGILCGLIDALWVKEFNPKTPDGDWKSSEKVNNFVIKVARAKGYEGDDLQGAILYLEKYHIASDPNLNDFGSGRQHHLRDFAHHPTIVGLCFSLITQFTEKCYGTDTTGRFICVEVKNKALIGKDIPQKLLFGVVFWFFHMVSDMAGSHDSPGAGTGLPGPIVSLLKEISSLPFFQNAKFLNKDGNSEFSVWISKLFNGTLFAERDENGKIIKESVKNFDLRGELSVAGEIGKQAVPVILNECIVRGFYFSSRLYREIKEKQIKSIHELNQIDFKKVIPMKNRTIVRMMTIASGTFSAVDLLDATIEGCIKGGAPVVAGVPNPKFFKEFVLRVNFVGIGRFAIAIGTDIGMGIKRRTLIKQRMQYSNEINMLQVSKVFYMQEGMWIEVIGTEQSINQLYETAEQSMLYFINTWKNIAESLENIQKLDVNKIEEHNPGLSDELKDILNWG